MIFSDSHSPVHGALLKVVRAEERLANLTALIQTYSEANPTQIEKKLDPATGDRVFRVRILSAPPVEWSIDIGEIVHGLRTSLDHLAWQAVIQNGRQPGRDTAFPVAESEAKFPTLLDRCLGGVGQPFRDFVRRLRPFKGGDPILWPLHQLDVIDKHRLLIPVGAAHRSVSVRTRMSVPWQPDPIVFPQLTLNPADRQFPLGDGAEIFRDCGTWPAEVHQDDPIFTFEVAFGEKDVVDGVAIVPTLRAMASRVHEVVQVAASVWASTLIVPPERGGHA